MRKHQRPRDVTKPHSLLTCPHFSFSSLTPIEKILTIHSTRVAVSLTDVKKVRNIKATTEQASNSITSLLSTHR